LEGRVEENIGLFYRILVHFVVFCHNLPHFGLSRQEKSGNPDVCTYPAEETHFYSPRRRQNLNPAGVTYFLIGKT
jgi:hypothetical protein